MTSRFSPLFWCMALPALLLGGCGLTGGDFPSLAPRPAETPRVIATEGDSAYAALSAEEHAALSRDLDSEQKAFVAASAEIAATRLAVSQRLAAPGVTQKASQAWSEAQMALSRFDLARTPLAEIDARLAPLQRMTEDLAATNPDRLAVEALSAKVRAESAAARNFMDKATSRLN